VQRLGLVLTTEGPGAEAASPAAEAPVAEAIGIRKHFGSTQALRGVDLSLRPGRCLGLVGRNGAGKSTLVSILSGIYPPDAGEVRFDGRPAPPLGAIGAWRGRISTVFQHSMVVPSLTVAENVFLGSQPGRGGFVDWGLMRERTRQVMAEWGLVVDAREPCANLNVEQRQVVEIARALAAGTRCLILDEPTAALERGAIQRLFERIRQLTASGVAILYISHHLEEVFEICRDVAVLRDGELAATAPVTELSKEDLVTAMVGAQAAQTQKYSPERRSGSGVSPGGAVVSLSQAPRLIVTDVSLVATSGSLRGVSLEVRAGERVGITGLRGSGATTLARVVAGATAPDSGQVQLDGRTLPPGSRAAALTAGVGYLPEDRHAEGFVPAFGVAENITLTITRRLARAGGFVRPRARDASAAPLARRLSIVSAGLRQPVGQLSGGNQQKVTAARALASDPKLIVAIAPTRGVDVASKELLLAELAAVAGNAVTGDAVTGDAGTALLLASDELDDLVVCDRIVVLVRGEVFTEFRDPPFDREALIAATEGMLANGHGNRPGNGQGAL
jgi:simple sugar transport system ATP-binding protein